MSRELTYLYMGKPAKYWAELEAENKALREAAINADWKARVAGKASITAALRAVREKEQEDE